jgi:hypothetical protein
MVTIENVHVAIDQIAQTPLRVVEQHTLGNSVAPPNGASDAT